MDPMIQESGPFKLGPSEKVKKTAQDHGGRGEGEGAAKVLKTEPQPRSEEKHGKNRVLFWRIRISLYT